MSFRPCTSGECQVLLAVRWGTGNEGSRGQPARVRIRNLRQHTSGLVNRGYAQAVEQARWPGRWMGLRCAVADFRAVGHGAPELGYPTKGKTPQVVDLRGF